MRSRSFLSDPSLLCASCALGVLALSPFVACGGGGSETTQAGGTTTGTTTSTTTGTMATTTTTGPSTSSSGGAGGMTSTSTTGGAGGMASTSTAGGAGGATATTTTVATTTTTGGGPLCGNGMLDPGEQCDDGNHFDLDGCDSACGFEVVTRMSTIAISGTMGPNFCVHKGNALGTKVISAVALGQLNTPLQMDVTNGTVNVLTEFLGLSDDTGTNAMGFSLGVVDGSPDPAKGMFPGNNPMDWSFLADPSVVNMGLPTGQLHNGKIVNHAITAGPSTVQLTLNLGGTPANLQMNNAAIAGTVGNATNAPMPPPTTIDPSLMVLETISANGNGQGLCGDVTVASLSQIPAPQLLTTSSMQSATICAENYTYCGQGAPVGSTCNSLLDVFVGGCHVVFGIAAVNPTQPDVAGNGSVQHLTAGNLKKVNLPANDTDAYSAYLQFATTREHFSGQTCAVDSDCQTGQTCTAAKCQ